MKKVMLALCVGIIGLVGASMASATAWVDPNIDYGAAALTGGQAIVDGVEGVIPIAVGIFAALTGIGLLFRVVRKGLHGA